MVFRSSKPSCERFFSGLEEAYAITLAGWGPRGGGRGQVRSGGYWAGGGYRAGAIGRAHSVATDGDRYDPIDQGSGGLGQHGDCTDIWCVTRDLKTQPLNPPRDSHVPSVYMPVSPHPPFYFLTSPTPNANYLSRISPVYSHLTRDWSLITGTGGGGLKNGKIAGPKLFAPPPPPLLKTG